MSQLSKSYSSGNILLSRPKPPSRGKPKRHSRKTSNSTSQNLARSLLPALKAALELTPYQNRTKSYTHTFNGSSAVHWLTQNVKECRDENHAIQLCSELVNLDLILSCRPRKGFSNSSDRFAFHDIGSIQKIVTTTSSPVLPKNSPVLPATSPVLPATSPVLPSSPSPLLPASSSPSLPQRKSKARISPSLPSHPSSAASSFDSTSSLEDLVQHASPAPARKSSYPKMPPPPQTHAKLLNFAKMPPPPIVKRVPTNDTITSENSDKSDTTQDPYPKMPPPPQTHAKLLNFAKMPPPPIVKRVPTNDTITSENSDKSDTTQDPSSQSDPDSESDDSDANSDTNNENEPVSENNDSKLNNIFRNVGTPPRLSHSYSFSARMNTSSPIGKMAALPRAPPPPKHIRKRSVSVFSQDSSLFQPTEEFPTGEIPEEEDFSDLVASAKSPARSPRLQTTTSSNSKLLNEIENAANSKDDVEIAPDFPELADHPALYGKDICWVKDDEGRLQVRGATIEKLITRLTYSHFPDNDFTKTFLMTMVGFTNHHTFISLLEDRLYIEPSDDIPESLRKDFSNSVLRPIRLRIANVLKTWFEKLSFGEFEDPQLVSVTKAFITGSFAVFEPVLSKRLNDTLNNLINDSLGKAADTILKVQPPKPILPNKSNFSFEQLSALEIARQFTIYDSNLYSKITPRECVNKNWSRENKHEIAPNIVTLTEKFNQLSAWIATRIVKVHNKKDRIKLVEFIISIMYHCFELKNFNSANAIMAGLNNSAVFRMKRTFSSIGRKAKSRYDKVWEILAPKSNFKAYRDAVSTCQPPVVPYVGLWFQDLTFIEDGNSDMLRDLPHLHNFSKRRQLGDVIGKILLYQKIHYALVRVSPIIKFLHEEMEDTLDDDALWEQSQIAEPRK